MGLHEVRSNFTVCSKYILTKVNIYIEMQVAVLPGAILPSKFQKIQTAKTPRYKKRQSSAVKVM